MLVLRVVFQGGQDEVIADDLFKHHGLQSPQIEKPIPVGQRSQAAPEDIRAAWQATDAADCA